MPELVLATAAGSVLLRVDLAGRDKLTIGRSRDCDVRLKGTEVARHHALVFEEQGVWRMLDLTVNVEHGVWAGEVRIGMIDLNDDQPLRIGDVFIWSFGIESGSQPRQIPALPADAAEQVLLREEQIERLWRGGLLHSSHSSGLFMRHSS